jgi:hypothetical protein
MRKDLSDPPGIPHAWDPPPSTRAGLYNPSSIRGYSLRQGPDHCHARCQGHAGFMSNFKATRHEAGRSTCAK